MKKLCWIVRIPELTSDRVNVNVESMERDHPVIVVPTMYMLDGDDQEEALFSALCQVMPTASRVARPGDNTRTPVACLGMGLCYWRQGAGWLDEPAPGATYYDPFDLLKKTPFLYKV